MKNIIRETAQNMQCSMYREQLLSWLWKTVMPTLADNFWERACSA